MYVLVETRSIRVFVWYSESLGGYVDVRHAELRTHDDACALLQTLHMEASLTS